MKRISDHLAANIRYWDKVVDYHAAAPFYDAEGVRRGKDTLDIVDTDALGDVSNRRLLHLHCHLGFDTISWARHGADVTGVDISPRAIALARAFAKELHVDGRFVCTDVACLPHSLNGQFDIACATEGILAWIPDLKAWMAAAARSLSPGGVLYVRDFHPIAEVFANNIPSLRLCRTYFHSMRRVTVDDETGTYADRSLCLRNSAHYEWQHSIQDVFEALIESGLVLLRFLEYPFCTYQSHRFLIQEAEKRWVFPPGKGDIPLMFSVLARRPISEE